MKLYITKTPGIIMRFFSKYTWRFSLNKKEIYLTFDDGPTPEITNFVLNELKKYNAKATFFCIGKNIENHPKIFNRIISEGHTVGNHTQNHFNGWQHNTKSYIDNVLLGEKSIKKVSKVAIQKKIFRPPYGKLKKLQAKEILKNGYKIIMWDVLSADFDKSISKEQCLKNVLKNTQNGSIIVFHDSVKAAEKVKFVLPKILKEYTERGFSFKSI